MTSFLVLSLFFGVAFSSHNVTIDDNLGDAVTGRLVSYSPPTGAWQQGATCSDCYLQPDSTQALDGTWHDSTYGGQEPGPYSFTLLFDGDAIYVYCILADGVPFATTATSLQFTLDNQPGGTFIWNPDNSIEKYTYNALVYGNTNIGSAPTAPSGLHNLTVQSLAAILFDYAVYTVPDPVEPSSTNSTSPPTSPVPSLPTSSSLSPSSQSSPTSMNTGPSLTSTSSSTSSSASAMTSTSSHASSKIVGPAVGGAVGGVVLIVVLLLLAVFLRRRYQKERNTLDLLGSPTDAPMSSAGPLIREVTSSMTNTSVPTREATLSSTDALTPLRAVPLLSPGASSSSMSQFAAGQAAWLPKNASTDEPALGEQSSVPVADPSRLRRSWTRRGLESEVAVLRRQLALLTQNQRWDDDEELPGYNADQHDR